MHAFPLTRFASSSVAIAPSLLFPLSSFAIHRSADDCLLAYWHIAAFGSIFHSFWRRMTATGSPGAQKRFIETFELFFRAVTQQAKDRASGNIPDLESYIAMRRDTSGCKPCWALIEYANNVSVEALSISSAERRCLTPAPFHSSIFPTR